MVERSPIRFEFVPKAWRSGLFEAWMGPVLTGVVVWLAIRMMFQPDLPFGDIWKLYLPEFALLVTIEGVRYAVRWLRRQDAALVVDRDNVSATFSQSFTRSVQASRIADIKVERRSIVFQVPDGLSLRVRTDLLVVGHGDSEPLAVATTCAGWIGVPVVDVNGAVLAGVSKERERPTTRQRLIERARRYEDLSGLDLSDVDYTGIDLRGLSLRSTNMRGPRPPAASVSTPSVWHRLADDTGKDPVRLAGADLRDADLTWARLTGADLSGADLRGARMVETDLRGADLGGADLRGTDLTGSVLEGSRTARARWDDATVWPDGFVPERIGTGLEP